MMINPNFYPFISMSICLIALALIFSHHNVSKSLREFVSYSMYYIYGFTCLFLNYYYLLSINYFVRYNSDTFYSIKVLVFLMICFGSPRIYDSMWNILVYKPNYMRLWILIYNSTLFFFCF